MASNRIRIFDREDRISRARRNRRRLERWAKCINAASGDTVHIFTPSARDLLTGETNCTAMLSYDLEVVPLVGMARNVAAQLRRIAASLLSGADGIEALAAKGGA